MVYIGSKNRIAKELIPIIQSYITDETEGYLEPFVGGANVIDKIKCKNRIGYDIHKQLISLYIKLIENKDEIPDEISKEEYDKVKGNKEDYEDWYLGLVGFLGSFGAKYFGGYAKHNRDDNTGQIQRGSIKNLKKQYNSIKDIEFKNIDFRDIDKDKFKNYVIYCDIPYRGTTKYKTEEFPYEEFYEWVKEMSVYNTVLISEYSMPKEFECIWQKESKVNFDSNRSKSDTRTERLYTYNKTI